MKIGFFASIRFTQNGVLRIGALTLLAILPLLFNNSALQAQEKNFDVLSYNATIKLDRLTDSISGVVTMTATTATAVTEIIQHAKYLTIDSVSINDGPAAFMVVDTQSGEYNVIPVGYEYVKSTFTLKTYYHGIGRPEQYGTLPWGGVTLSDSMMFAMGVGFGAPYTGCTRHWLPCYDLPDDKADSVDLTFICRDGDVTASNGLLISNTSQNGWRSMHWHISHPVATYLLTFATGPYTVQNIPNSLGKPFEVYALKRDSLEANIQMNVRVRQVLAFYDSLFAPYPFEKVGYVVTPIGSMESQTMICLDKHVLVGDSAQMAKNASPSGTTAAHELAHMWWGDRVTSKTFDDAWLNEGFACYCESLVLEHLLGRAQYLTRQHSNITGAKSSTLPLFAAATANNHANNYPYSTIYQKGAAVLGMLRQYLGDSLFFDCVRYYGNKHAYSTATSNDLWQDFEHASGQDLGWFFKPWLVGVGYPKDTITWSRTSTSAQITFHQAFNNTATPYYRMAVPVRGATKSGQSKIVTVWMDSAQLSTASADFGFSPDSIIIDPDGLLIMRTVKVSELAAIVPSERNELYYALFPNPSHHQPIELELGAANPLGTCEVNIFDSAGRIIRHEMVEAVGRQFHETVDVTGMPSGTYRIQIESAGTVLAGYPFSIEL